MIYSITKLQLCNYSYILLHKMILWLGSPQHEEHYLRGTALGWLRTTNFEEGRP